MHTRYFFIPLFNKENFNKNASRNVKEKIKYILDEIENKEE